VLSVRTEKFRASYGFSKAEKTFSGYPVAGDSDSYSSRKLIAVITTEMKVPEFLDIIITIILFNEDKYVGII